MFNIYLFLYIHQHTFIYIYIYIYIGIDIYINIYLLIYTYNFTYIYICIYTCYHILCGTLGIYLFILIFWFIDEPHPRALIIWRKKYLVHIHKNKNQTCWKTFFITHSTYLRAKKSPVMLMLLFHPTGITGCLHNLLLGHVQRFCCYIYITFKHHLHTNLSSIIVNKIQLLCKRNRYLFKLIKYTILS